MKLAPVLATCFGWSLIAIGSRSLAAEINTTTEYAAACEAELGAPIPKFDCYTSGDGWTVKEIELFTTDDATGKRVKVTAPKDNERAGLEAGTKCDTPFLIDLGEDDTACVPYATLGVKEVNSTKGGKTEFVFICRPYYFRKPGARAKNGEPPRTRFDDLGFIGHHVDSGATCFWSVPQNERGECVGGGEGACTAKPFGEDCPCDAGADCNSGDCRNQGYCSGGAGNCSDLPYGPGCECEEDDDCDGKCVHRTLSFDGSKVPIPGSSGTPGTTDLDFWTDGRPNTNFWKTLPEFVGDGQCMECHDSDPFVHVPSIEGVKLVPKNPRGPYWPVAEKDLVRIAKAAGDTGEEWLPAKVLKKGGANDPKRPCTQCHRIGSRRTCTQFVDDSAGLDKHEVTYSTRYSTITGGGTYAYDRWMAPAFAPGRIQAAYNTSDDWEKRFGDAVTTITECCEDLDSTDCWRDMPRTAKEAKTCCATPTGRDYFDLSYVDTAVCEQQPGAFSTDAALCNDAPAETCCRFADGGSFFHDTVTTDYCTQIAGEEVAAGECDAATAQVCCQIGAGPYAYGFHSAEECTERLDGVAVDPSSCPTSICCEYSSDGSTRYRYASLERCTGELGGTVAGSTGPCEANFTEVCCQQGDGSIGLVDGLFCAPPATILGAAACSCSALGGTICESGGNDACRGQGPNASDCEHCCGGTASPTCDEIGGTTCEVAGNGLCGGVGPTTYDCDHCCGNLAYAVPCPALGGAGIPFGDDDAGCLPPDKSTRLCETAVGKSTRKATECVLKCHRRRARGAVSASGQAACESACQQYYLHAVDKPRLETLCPTCLSSATRAGLFTLADTVVDALNPSLFCAPGVPFGGDDAGFIPSDHSDARCEHEVAKAVGKAIRCISKCHQKRARGLVDAAGEEVCESDPNNPDSCQSKYRRKTFGLRDCPACLTVADRDGLHAAVESMLDFSNAAIYCAP